MRKTRFIGFALALVLLAGIASTASAAARKQPTAVHRDTLVISVGDGAAGGNYDPCKGYGSSGINLFQTALLKINTRVQTEPDIASSYTISDDRLVYTFTIRSGIKFSDGVTLTPDDVVF
ncbi:MAG: ABC transporter substrate-binding protein, partial [Spirochaetaceae bacterium]|nr:ABC transporter substrate-binding protein [Spirochaetaceae bacterium]